MHALKPLLNVEHDTQTRKVYEFMEHFVHVRYANIQQQQSHMQRLATSLEDDIVAAEYWCCMSHAFWAARDNMPTLECGEPIFCIEQHTCNVYWYENVYRIFVACEDILEHMNREFQLFARDPMSTRSHAILYSQHVPLDKLSECYTLLTRGIGLCYYAHKVALYNCTILSTHMMSTIERLRFGSMRLRIIQSWVAGAIRAHERKHGEAARYFHTCVELQRTANADTLVMYLQKSADIERRVQAARQYAMMHEYGSATIEFNAAIASGWKDIQKECDACTSSHKIEIPRSTFVAAILAASPIATQQSSSSPLSIGVLQRMTASMQADTSLFEKGKSPLDCATIALIQPPM